MRFIKRKNMQEGEELLYVPHLHWFFLVKKIVLSIPFFLVLFIFWRFADSNALFASTGSVIIKDIFVRIFLFALLIVLLEFLWRIFQYLNIEYGVTNKRLMLKKGVIRLETTEISIDRIESIYCTQGLFGRIFCYGTICISGVGGMKPVFFMVHRPYALRRKIVEILEKNKVINVVHGDLPRFTPEKPPKPVKEDPVHLFGNFVRVLPENKKWS